MRLKDSWLLYGLVGTVALFLIGFSYSFHDYAWRRGSQTQDPLTTGSSSRDVKEIVGEVEEEEEVRVVEKAEKAEVVVEEEEDEEEDEDEGEGKRRKFRKPPKALVELFYNRRNPKTMPEDNDDSVWSVYEGRCSEESLVIPNRTYPRPRSRDEETDETPAELRTPDGLVMVPNYKTIWVAGFGLVNGSAKASSWTSDLPRLFLYRYPHAKVFLVRQGFRYPEHSPICELKRPRGISPRPPKNLLVNHDLRSFPEEEGWICYPARDHNIVIAKENPPDLVFIRNAFDVQQYLAHLPAVLAPNVFRAIYPVLRVNEPELVDMVYPTNRFYKVQPQWQFELTESVIKELILDQRSFELTSKGRQALVASFGQDDYDPSALTEEQQKVLGIDSGAAYDEFGFRNVMVKKENYLFLIGTMYARKGQLYFARVVDACVLKKYNLTIVFAGKIPDRAYWKQVQETLEAKSIPYIHLGWIHDRTPLLKVYLRAKAMVELGRRRDPGPRTAYEALYTNTPFLTNEYIEVDARIRHLGIQFPTVDVTTEQLTKGIDRLMATQWDDAPIAFARKHLNPEVAYGRLFNELDTLFCLKFPSKCVLQPQSTPIQGRT